MVIRLEIHFTAVSLTETSKLAPEEGGHNLSAAKIFYINCLLIVCKTTLGQELPCNGLLRHAKL